MLHCCETWAAMARMDQDLLEPLRARFGAVVLTYGFAGRELVKAIEARAAEEKRLPNISPGGDQHAGHELNTWGNRICKRGGIAVDLRVPGHGSLDVARWIQDEKLPFDRMYLYDDVRPFHMSWHPQPIGQVIQMWVTKTGKLMPKVIVKGKTPAPAKMA
jgi:hypothetical protein